MKNTKETSFAVSPSVNLTVKVFLHPNIKALRRAYSEGLGQCLDVLAYCYYDTDGPVDDVIAELHFYPGHFNAATIAHEALHCVLVLGRYLRLNLEHDAAEELLAEAHENIVYQTLKFKQSLLKK